MLVDIPVADKITRGWMTVHKSGSKGENKAKMREIQQNRRPENAFFCLSKSLTKIMETNSCQNNPGPKFYSSSSSKGHSDKKNFPSFVGPKGFLSSHKLYCTTSINGNYTKPLLYIDDAHRFLTIYISHHHKQGPRALIKRY